MGEILSELFEYAKIGVPVAWGVLVRQVYVIAVQRIIYSLLLFVPGAVFCFRLFRQVRNWDDWVGADATGARVFFALAGVALAVIAVGLIVSSAARFINPPYYVILWLRDGQW